MKFKNWMWIVAAIIGFTSGYLIEPAEHSCVNEEYKNAYLKHVDSCDCHANCIVRFKQK